MHACPPSPSLLDKAEIAELLPFSARWILVDRVAECSPPGFIVTHKRVEADDPFLAGFFRLGPIVLPGVLLIEFASQSACLLGALSEAACGRRPPRLLARCSAQFLSPAHAGDLLTAEIRLTDASDGGTLHEATVRCGERLVCRARLFAAPVSASAGAGAAPARPGARPA